MIKMADENARQELEGTGFSPTPVLDAFKRNGFDLCAVVLSSKKPRSKGRSRPQIGRYIAILDTNYMLEGEMDPTLFSDARREVLPFVNELYAGADGDSPAELYREVRKILGE